MTDDHTYNTESLHTPESRERDARLVGHEWKGEAIGDDRFVTCKHVRFPLCD